MGLAKALYISVYYWYNLRHSVFLAEYIETEDARMVENGKSRKIMTKPLPQILDEIEDSIRLADEAAKNARDAAVEARKAGDKAFSEATKVANERIDQVEQIAKNALKLAELLKLAVIDGVATIDKRLSEKASKD
jgi:hypothetical protein